MDELLYSGYSRLQSHAEGQRRNRKAAVANNAALAEMLLRVLFGWAALLVLLQPVTACYSLLQPLQPVTAGHSLLQPDAA